MPTNKTRILDAARDLFAERGFHGATTRAIGERAGVSASLVHTHFHTKAELLRIIVHDSLDDVAERLEAAFDATKHMDSERAVIGTINTFVGWASRNPEIVRIWLECAGSDTLMEITALPELFLKKFLENPNTVHHRFVEEYGIEPYDYGLLWFLTTGACYCTAVAKRLSPEPSSMRGERGQLWTEDLMGLVVHWLTERGRVAKSN